MLFVYTVTVFWQMLRCLNIFVNLMNVSDGRVPESFRLNTFVSNVTFLYLLNTSGNPQNSQTH